MGGKTTINALDSALQEVERAKRVAEQQLVQYIVVRICEVAASVGIDVTDVAAMTGFLAGRSLQVCFTFDEERRVCELAKELYLSPDNLGDNVLRALQLETALTLRLCNIGDHRYSMEKYLSLRGEFL